MNQHHELLELDELELATVRGGGIVEGDCIPFPCPRFPEPIEFPPRLD